MAGGISGCVNSGGVERDGVNDLRGYRGAENLCIKTADVASVGMAARLSTSTWRGAEHGVTA